jgi:hypothetical protein
MDLLVVVLAFLLLAVVIALVGAPLRAARDQELAGEHVLNDDDPERRQAYERARLESAREAKYGEIRDAELDMRTGKLSREDYEAVDSALRAEALEVLDRLQALERDEGDADASHARMDDRPRLPAGPNDPVEDLPNREVEG